MQHIIFILTQILLVVISANRFLNHFFGELCQHTQSICKTAQSKFIQLLILSANSIHPIDLDSLKQKSNETKSAQEVFT